MLPVIGARPQLSARRSGDSLVLDGVVRAVPLAAQANLALLPVQLDGQVRVVAVPQGTAGASVVEGRSQRHLALADIAFTQARIEAVNLLEDAALAWIEPRLVAALAAQQAGVSAGQLARTVEYVSQRKQFGRVIGSFQLVAGQLADAKIALEALRSALAQLIYRSDAGLGCEVQSLAVKVLAAQAAHLVGHKAQHVHGGMGVTDEMRVGHYFKRTTMLDATFGNVDYHLRRFTALNQKNAA